MMKQANAKQEEEFAVAQTQPKNKGGRPKLGTHMAAMEFNVYDKDRDAIAIICSTLEDQRGKPVSMSEAVRTAVRQWALRCVAQGRYKAA